MLLKALQELMGHATIGMTERYAHLSPEVKRDAVQLLDEPLLARGNTGRGNGRGLEKQKPSNLSAAGLLTSVEAAGIEAASTLGDAPQEGHSSSETIAPSSNDDEEGESVCSNVVRPLSPLSAEVAEYRRKVPPQEGCRACAGSFKRVRQACLYHSIGAAVAEVRELRARVADTGRESEAQDAASRTEGAAGAPKKHSTVKARGRATSATD
nr:hypothetical protein [Corallococcus macrosporus]